MKTPAFIKKWHIHGLIRVACYLAIVALLLMCWSVLFPAALPVVVGMSVGQGIGVLAFLCFLTAILMDAQRTPPLPPPEKTAARSSKLVIEKEPPPPLEDEPEDEEPDG